MLMMWGVCYQAHLSVVFEKRPPNAFEMTDFPDSLRDCGAYRVVTTGMKTQYCVHSTCRAACGLSFDAVMIADDHTCSGTPVMKAEDIVVRHNATLDGPFCHEDWCF